MMRFAGAPVSCLFAFAVIAAACSQSSGANPAAVDASPGNDVVGAPEAGADASSGDGGGAKDAIADAISTGDGGTGDGGTGGDGTGGGGTGDGEVRTYPSPDAAAVGQGSVECATATSVPLDSAEFMVDLDADTSSTADAAQTIQAPCATSGHQVFYRLNFTKSVFLYADTFGASYPTALYLLSGCTPLTTSTTPGDAVCSAGACGASQSQLVALLDPGEYQLGVGSVGSAQGPVTVHLQWALAPSGAVTELPQGKSSQSGATIGSSGNLSDAFTTCPNVGPEDGYWWTSCPTDSGGTLSASSCDNDAGVAADFETVLELQVPGVTPYTCDTDTCGLQSALTASIPSGPGLRILYIGGQTGTDSGRYTMAVTRP